MFSKIKAGFAPLLLLLFILIVYNNSFAGQYSTVFQNTIAATDNATQKTQAQSTASSLNQLYTSKYGNSSGLNNNAVTPLISPTNMTTLNGQKSFNGQIECPSQKDFLSLFFEPTSTNDFTVIISENTNLKQSNPTYETKTPLISGICTDGFISCNPGTWNNCHYYQWDISTNGDVSWTSFRNDTTLGSCFCTNSSCGATSPFMDEFNQIASTFGSGLADRIATTLDFAISNVQSSADSSTINYYGQSANQCTTIQLQNSTGYPSNPSQYLNNGQLLSTTGTSVANESKNQKSTYTKNGVTAVIYSPYNLVTQNQFMNQNPVTEKTCQIAHLVTVNIFQGPTTGQMACPSGSVPITSTCKWTQCIVGGSVQINSSPGSTIWNIQDSSGGTTCQFDNNCDLICNSNSHWREWPIHVSLPGYNQYHTTTGTVLPGQTTTLYTGGYVGSPSNSIWPNDSTHIVDCMQITQQTNNSCAGQDLSKCKLRDEQVCDQNGQNCVTVYQDHQYMNPTIPPMCYQYSVNHGVLFNLCANGSNITYQDDNTGSCPGYNGTIPNQGTLDQSNNNTDWWIINKTYDCEAQQTPVPNLSREENVENNSSYGSGTGLMNYPDTTTEYGGIGGYSSSFQAQYLQKNQYPSCQYSCVVTAPANKTSVVNEGKTTVGQPGQASASSNEKYILACQQDSNGNWDICPATGNETIIQPCTCLNEGVRAIAVFSAMVSAAKDMICSQK